jgi:tetratricopeptide (TPR) repeat protein
MNLRTALAAAALALVAAPLAACSSTDQAASFRDFQAGRYPQARARWEEAIAKAGDDDALERNEAGTIALVQGDVEGAHRHFAEGFNAMEDLTSTTGEAAVAMVGPESSKRWKGDPYERCMNAYYLGVTYWMKGDPDNAAAAFKSGVLRDADSETGAAQSDFALLYYLMGMAQREANHSDRGAAALAQAHQLLPGNPWLNPARADEADLLLVVDLGFGPEKYATGPSGADLKFRPRPYRAAYADVSADGKPLGRTARAVDIYQQAITRGDKVLDHVNKGKAVFKTAAVIAGIGVLSNSGSQSSDLIGALLILIGILTPAEADTRQWDTLPGEVQVLDARLGPGEHVLAVDVRDGSGQPIPSESKTVRVTVSEGRTAFVWTRAAVAEQTPVGADTMGPRP